MQKQISEMFLEESFDWFRANIKWDFVPDFNSIDIMNLFLSLVLALGIANFCFAACRVS